MIFAGCRGQCKLRLNYISFFDWIDDVGSGRGWTVHEGKKQDAAHWYFYRMKLVSLVLRHFWIDIMSSVLQELQIKGISTWPAESINGLRAAVTWLTSFWCFERQPLTFLILIIFILSILWFVDNKKINLFHHNMKYELKENIYNLFCPQMFLCAEWQTVWSSSLVYRPIDSSCRYL